MFLFASASVKIEDSVFNAASCSFPIVTKGAVGVGFCSVCDSSVAVTVVASTDESIGIVPRCGKNLGIRMIRVALVVGTKT